MAVPQASEAASRPMKLAEPQPQPGALTSASATRPTAAASSPAPIRSGLSAGPLVFALRHHLDGQDHGGQPDRQVDPEHPAPVDLYQAAADHRAERRAQGAQGRPGAQGLRPGGRRDGGQHERQGRGHHHPGAGRLDDPGRDQRGHARRQPAQQRPEAERGQPGDQRPAPPDPVGPPARGHQHRREHDRVGVEHPGQRTQAGARVLLGDGREGQVDDEQVQARHEHGQRKHADHGGHPAPIRRARRQPAGDLTGPAWTLARLRSARLTLGLPSPGEWSSPAVLLVSPKSGRTHHTPPLASKSRNPTEEVS